MTNILEPTTCGEAKGAQELNTRNDMKQDNYYRTRSLPLAEFLYAKGHSVKGIDTVGQAKETAYMELL